MATVAQEIIDRVICAMFAQVASEYPDIASGDFAPEQQITLETAVRSAVEGWVENNK